jgi:hypothetical protein
LIGPEKKKIKSRTWIKILEVGEEGPV